jgi:hypothetical protein
VALDFKPLHQAILELLQPTLRGNILLRLSLIADENGLALHDLLFLFSGRRHPLAAEGALFLLLLFDGHLIHG